MKKKKTIRKKAKRKVTPKRKLAGEVIQVVPRTSSACLEKGEFLLDAGVRQVPIIGTFKIPKPKRRNKPDKNPCCKKIKRPPGVRIMDIKAAAGGGRLTTLSVAVKAGHPCGISFVAGNRRTYCQI